MFRVRISVHKYKICLHVGFANVKAVIGFTRDYAGVVYYAVGFVYFEDCRNRFSPLTFG